ncbi:MULTISPECIES: PKD domain-containing protein [unclassified Blastococcus]
MISPALPFPDGTWSYAAGTPRYAWTTAAIDGARAEGIPWVVVGIHKPCLSLGVYSCEIGGDLMQLLVDRRVDLVLHGHEHLYQRTHQLGTRTGCAAVTPGVFDADCVADADADMAQGAGTVFATSGAGGQELRSVNTADPEAGFFAASSGSNRSPSYGFLDLRITADQLAGRFLPVSGGTFTDSFTIRRGEAPPPPPNARPTPSFTSTAAGLTVALDGRASTDPDGTVAGHSWDLGDGTAPAVGAQVQHTYAAAGSYPVTLTVTDDDGATAVLTRTVTVAAAPPTGAFVTDTFARTVTGGWGTAEVGGAWTTSGTTGYSVGSGAAALALTRAGTTRSAWVGPARTDTDLRLTLAVDRVPTGNGAYVDVVGRRVGTDTEYQARVVLLADGRVNVSLRALRGSATASTIAAGTTLPVSAVSYAAGTPLNVRLQVTGTSPTQLRVKVWRADQPEPAAWQLSATDSGAGLQAGGAVGVTAYLSSSATNAPVTLRISQLGARPVG